MSKHPDGWGFNPGEDTTPFLGSTTVGDIHSIVASFARKNLRKRGYKESWIGDRMDELMQELWCEVQRARPKIDQGHKNWRSYILTTVSNYLKGWCMNNPHWSKRQPIWSRTMAESTKNKHAKYHASRPISCLSTVAEGEEGKLRAAGWQDEHPVFACDNESALEVSEALVEIKRKVEDPITRAVLLLYGSGYKLTEIRDILKPVYNVSHQSISNRLKEGRRLLA
jgi:DNA-directed RNA polymerase specialized sigma24 family protein